MVYPTLTSSVFGQTHSGTNYGIMFFGYAIGALLGPQIAARFIDQSAGVGAYRGAYMVAICVALVGLVIDVFLIAKKIGTKEKEQ